MRTLTMILLLCGVLLGGCVDENTPDTADKGVKATPADDALAQNATDALGNVTRGATVLAEPTFNESFQILVVANEASTWTFTANNWSLIASTPGSGTFKVDAPAFDTPGKKVVNYTVAGTGTSMGNLTFDVWGMPIQFAAEPGPEHTIRPGMYSQVCTTNFIFQYKWYRLFIGTAAHCADSAEGGDCISTQMAYGSTETLEGGIETTRAWSSWNAMNEHGGCHGNNDFGLFEIHPDDWDKVHPKAYGAMGHIAGLGDCRDLEPNVAYGGSSTDLELKSYGRSSLRSPGVRSAPDDPRNDKVGEFLEADSGGYQCHVYYNSPGIPGDSGGPLATMDGKALGAASTVTLAPTAGSNHYTNIARVFEFMMEHEGWAPEVVTSV